MNPRCQVFAAESLRIVSVKKSGAISLCYRAAHRIFLRFDF